ncbi:hypothetical protein AB0I77_31745 [Streptomyces sp. NPDC050619]|uniref:hypothetical protein n=1 Tax=Streptomyces sp. NPDC050619 TaxID=3157214 RepID=UPI00341B5573
MPEISEHPRPADINQLLTVYLMHRQECPTCTPDLSCEMARRLEEARTAGVMSGVQCTECARLEREKQAACMERDLSRITDCDVLLKRHPDHSEKRPAAGRRRA